MCFLKLPEAAMNGQRIKTILLHTWYHFTHSMETWADLFWIPILQLLVFVFIASSLGGGGEVQARAMILGMIFWNIIGVGQYAIAVGALWEIWSKSFSSLFITPLTLEEFLVGQMISSLFKSFLAFGLSAVVGFWLYQFSIFTFGWMLPVYIVELLIFSWAAGMLVLSLIFRFGPDVQALSWSFVYLIQPIGAVFYPVAVLPTSLQWIARTLPTTYVFEAMRHELQSGQVDTANLVVATILNILYFVVGYVVLRWSFWRAQRTGAFARMES